MIDDPTFKDEAFKKGQVSKALKESGEMERARKAIDDMDALEEAMMGINPVQIAQFELMREASFNNFDGQSVVDDLIRYKGLWKGATFGTFNLIPLRDIHEGHWNADTLMISSTGLDDDKLELLAKTWKATEVWWLSDEDLRRYGLGGRRVLRVWWD